MVNPMFKVKGLQTQEAKPEASAEPAAASVPEVVNALNAEEVQQQTEQGILPDPNLAASINAQSKEVGDLKQLLAKYPHLDTSALQGYIAQAEMALAAGQPVPDAIFTQIHQAVGDIEVKQALAAVGGGAMALGAASMGALSDLTHLVHLDGKLGMTGAILLKNHMGAAEDDKNKVVVQSSTYEQHFNPGVINPGVQVAVMRSIDKGQGMGIGTRQG